jgi:hypothetical protein
METRCDERGPGSGGAGAGARRVRRAVRRAGHGAREPRGARLPRGGGAGGLARRGGDGAGARLGLRPLRSPCRPARRGRGAAARAPRLARLDGGGPRRPAAALAHPHRLRRRRRAAAGRSRRHGRPPPGGGGAGTRHEPPARARHRLRAGPALPRRAARTLGASPPGRAHARSPRRGADRGGAAGGALRQPLAHRLALGGAHRLPLLPARGPDPFPLRPGDEVLFEAVAPEAMARIRAGDPAGGGAVAVTP